MEKGWLKLHRELTEKAIWNQSTPEQKVILITLLMMANHDAKEWEWKGEKYTILPGQLITSLGSIAEKAGPGISIRNIRTALDKFEKYGFLTNQSTNKNRLITIVNWELYQSKDTEPTKQLTSNRQATDKQLTTNKNDKNYKNDKNIIYTRFEQEIFEYWNEKRIKTAKKTSNLQKVIHTAIKKFGVEQIKIAIDNYCTIFNDKNYFYNHLWFLDKFLKQKNGVPEFLSDGSRWVNYLRDKNAVKTGENKPSNARNFDQREYESEYLESLYENS